MKRCPSISTRLLWALLFFSIFLNWFLIYHPTRYDSVWRPFSNKQKDRLETPEFSIMIRMYKNTVMEYWQVFAFSYLLFWPKSKHWPNSELVLVFDEESVNDHQISTVISAVPPYPKIRFEKPPPKGTLCARWRTIGYARQIYSTFYSDLYSDAEYIGITDTDTLFIAKVLPEDLFVNGKPRIFGYNGCCVGWEQSAETIIPGKPPVGEFMLGIGFPFIVKRKHFELFRNHAVKTYNVLTFEQAFHYICSNWDGYTQFNFLAYYLFYFHRDDYFWNLRNNLQAHHPMLKKGLMSNDTEIMQRSTLGTLGVMKHYGHFRYELVPFLLYDYVCVAEKFSENIGSCSNEPEHYRNKIKKLVERNFGIDFAVPTGFYAVRQLPHSPVFKSPQENDPINLQDLLQRRDRFMKIHLSD